MATSWRGIFVIVATPFTEGYELDEAGLRRQIRFCLDAGVHGLVGPAFASEFNVLADDERRRFIEILIGECAGQLPVIAATHALHTVPAVAASRHAAAAGADGIMNLPPYVAHLDGAGCYDHYAALSHAVEVPLIIQNMIGPVGTPMGSDLLARMCRELEQVQYIKEETLPEPRMIETTIAAAGDDCRGVFGGRGGICMLDEFARGACGNMPGASNPDVIVDIWRLLEAGDAGGARTLFNRLLPLMVFHTQFGMGVVKEILYRRGIIATPLSRLPGTTLNDADRRELDAVLAETEVLFRV